MGLTTTVSLEPDPIPLDVKVVLFGDRTLYYLLAALTPTLDSTSRCWRILMTRPIGRWRVRCAGRLIGGIATEEKLRPLDRGGVSRAVEHAARLAEMPKSSAAGRRCTT